MDIIHIYHLKVWLYLYAFVSIVCIVYVCKYESNTPRVRYAFIQRLNRRGKVSAVVNGTGIQKNVANESKTKPSYILCTLYEHTLQKSHNLNGWVIVEFCEMFM